MAASDRTSETLKGLKTALQVTLFITVFLPNSLAVPGATAASTQYSKTFEFCLTCQSVDDMDYQKRAESPHFRTHAGAR